MSQVTVTLPDDAARTFQVPPDRLGDELKIAAAMKLLEMGRISSGKAAELAGIPKPVFLGRMADYGVVTFQGSKEELRRDAGLD